MLTNLVSFLIGDLNGHAGDGSAGLHGIPQGAGLFADIAAEDFMAKASQGFPTGNAGYLLCCLVEEANPPLLINAEHPLVEAVENGFEPIVG